MAQKGPQRPPPVQYDNSLVPLYQIWGYSSHFEKPIKWEIGSKQAPATCSGPQNHSKMAQNGPQRPPPVRYGNTLSYYTRFRAIQTCWAQKGSVTLGQNETHSKANHSKLLNLQIGLTLSILGLFESFKKLKSPTSQCLCSHIWLFWLPNS